MKRGACEESLCTKVQAVCSYLRTFCSFRCSHALSIFSLTKCDHFLSAISSAEEFSSLPIASSTTGGPIILIPYRDSEREEWGLRGVCKATHYL